MRMQVLFQVDALQAQDSDEFGVSVFGSGARYARSGYLGATQEVQQGQGHSLPSLGSSPQRECQSGEGFNVQSGIRR